MLFMVIEHFQNQDAKAVYARYHESGRKLPDTRGIGLRLVRSFISLTTIPRLRLGPARARPDRAARRLARDTGQRLMPCE